MWLAIGEVMNQSTYLTRGRARTRLRAVTLALATAIGAIGATGVIGPHAHAAPMAYKDGQMLSLDYERLQRGFWINHSFTARDALGIGVMDMRMPGIEIIEPTGVTHVHAGTAPPAASIVREKTLQRESAEVTYTRRLARWNLPAAQANLWFMAGVGGVRGTDFNGTRTAYTPGFQADYETTRLYLMASSRWFRAKDIKHDTDKIRAGFSFYEVNYDEPQPWLLLEVRKVRGLTQRPEISPMFRVIHRRWFVDVSVDVSKQPKREYNGIALNNPRREAKLNVMYTF
jgi:hypothetical protein